MAEDKTPAPGKKTSFFGWVFTILFWMVLLASGWILNEWRHNEFEFTPTLAAIGKDTDRVVQALSSLLPRDEAAPASAATRTPPPKTDDGFVLPPSSRPPANTASSAPPSPAVSRPSVPQSTVIDSEAAMAHYNTAEGLFQKGEELVAKAQDAGTAAGANSYLKEAIATYDAALASYKKAKALAGTSRTIDTRISKTLAQKHWSEKLLRME